MSRESKPWICIIDHGPFVHGTKEDIIEFIEENKDYSWADDNFKVYRALHGHQVEYEVDLSVKLIKVK